MSAAKHVDFNEIVWDWRNGMEWSAGSVWPIVCPVWSGFHLVHGFCTPRLQQGRGQGYFRGLGVNVSSDPLSDDTEGVNGHFFSGLGMKAVSKAFFSWSWKRYIEFQGLLSQWVGRGSLLLPAFVCHLSYLTCPPQAFGTQIFGDFGVMTTLGVSCCKRDVESSLGSDCLLTMCRRRWREVLPVYWLVLSVRCLRSQASTVIVPS